MAVSGNEYRRRIFNMWVNFNDAYDNMFDEKISFDEWGATWFKTQYTNMTDGCGKCVTFDRDVWPIVKSCRRVNREILSEWVSFKRWLFALRRNEELRKVTQKCNDENKDLFAILYKIYVKTIWESPAQELIRQMFRDRYGDNAKLLYRSYIATRRWMSHSSEDDDGSTSVEMTPENELDAGVPVEAWLRLLENYPKLDVDLPVLLQLIQCANTYKSAENDINGDCYDDECLNMNDPGL